MREGREGMPKCPIKSWEGTAFQPSGGGSKPPDYRDDFRKSGEMVRIKDGEGLERRGRKGERTRKDRR